MSYADKGAVVAEPRAQRLLDQVRDGCAHSMAACAWSTPMAVGSDIFLADGKWRQRGTGMAKMRVETQPTTGFGLAQNSSQRRQHLGETFG